MRQSVRQRNWYDLERGNALVVNASITLDGITVDIAPADAGTIDAAWTQVTAAGATVIPNSDGAFLVEVENVGGLVDGTNPAAIDVNGDTVYSGGRWESKTFTDSTQDPPVQYFSGEVTVTNASGSAFRYRVFAP